MHNFFDRHKIVEGTYDLNQIEVEYELGRGNSYVYSVRIEGINYAMKQIQIKNQTQYENFMKEIKVMKNISDNCQEMIKYEGYFVTLMEINQYEKHKYAFIIMEMAQANMEQLINDRRQKGKRWKQWEIQKAIEFMLCAFVNLENLLIAHCDIKPQNILVVDYDKMIMKLCDVGSCKIISKQNAEEATILGTIPFLAPQLIVMNAKSNKIVSADPFKSDVFSFGLVVLYILTFKKFKSSERVQIEESAYQQVISEWVKEAKELGGEQISVLHLLKYALQFDEKKRPHFKELKQIYEEEKAKRTSQMMKERDGLEGSQCKSPTTQLQNTKSFTSTPGNQLSKSRGLRKAAIKTNTNGFRTRDQRQPNSPQMGRKTSSFSPQKSNSSITDIKRIIYVNEQTKQRLPYESIISEEKIFVLNVPYINFRNAETVVMLKNCNLSVVNEFKNLRGKNFYIDYYGFDGVGLLEDVPFLNFQKISINLCQASLVGGYRGVFKMITGPTVSALEVRLTGSDVCYEQVEYLLDRLSGIQISSLLFCWQKNHLTQDMHYNLTQKIGKINLKKLTMLMSENFIESDREMRWAFPKNLQSLHLDYDRNFLTKLINNLSVSISQLKLKELFISLEGNNLGRGEINMLFKAIHSIESLERLMINVSRNKLEDIKFISGVLVENTTNTNSLQLKMHHVEVPIQKILDLIETIRQLFQFKLKILKISCNRTMKKAQFLQKIEQIIPNQKFKIDLIGIDNQHFVLYLKKKQKKPTNSTNPTNFNTTMDSITNKGLKDLKIGYHRPSNPSINKKNDIQVTSPQKISTMQMSTPSIPLNITNQIPTTNGLCTSLYKSEFTFDNYQCLSCCQFSQFPQIYKNTYFCKWCVQNCSHKGHNVVKAFARTRCSCAYSGCCLSDVKYRICAEDLSVRFKKQYECLKCEQFLCLSCIETCKADHNKWVQTTKDGGMRYFQCTGKRGGGNGCYDYQSLRSIQ